MEYIVSARKYRPSSFDTVVGQQSLTTTLKNAVASGKLAHAYLFCGPRGVGKTTCARIFAKVINCTNPKPDGDACGECESCKAFAEQRSMNIFELDAASNNGVEHIKSLMEQTRIPPQVGTYKVFIIDEVHMLSQAAFNAFLKTLEEPPAHVVFILATTEKHKILPTILSRCQVYDFERMTVQGIVGHLKKVAEDQGYKYEEQALSLIAEKADGGMRDALSIFDQVASYCQGDIRYAKTIEDLNVLDADNYFKAIDLALECKVAEEMVLLNSILEKGFDGGHFINGLAAHVRNVLMAHDQQTLKLIETSDSQRQQYAEQAKKCQPKFLYNALRILNECDLNYRTSSSKRLLVELSLIEIAQIMQKDEDCGVGRRPGKRLKSLFKKISNQLQQQSIQQGNATTANSTIRTTSSASARGTQATQPAPTANASQPEAPKVAAPRVRLSGVGVNFNVLSNSNKTNVTAQKLDDKPKENETFNDNQLRLEWLAMCNRMEENKMGGMAIRLKNLVPTITTYPTVEVVVENEMLLNEIKEIRARIELTLAQKLHNGDITLNVRMAEQTERQRFLTPKETFEEMMKEYADLTYLCKELELEME